eukprot:2776022-Rhodomonas_salina.5
MQEIAGKAISSSLALCWAVGKPAGRVPSDLEVSFFDVVVAGQLRNSRGLQSTAEPKQQQHVSRQEEDARAQKCAGKHRTMSVCEKQHVERGGLCPGAKHWGSMMELLQDMKLCRVF